MDRKKQGLLVPVVLLPTQNLRTIALKNIAQLCTVSFDCNDVCGEHSDSRSCGAYQQQGRSAGCLNAVKIKIMLSVPF